MVDQSGSAAPNPANTGGEDDTLQPQARARGDGAAQRVTSRRSDAADRPGPNQSLAGPDPGNRGFLGRGGRANPGGPSVTSKLPTRFNY